MKILEDLYYTTDLYESLQSPACRKEIRAIDKRSAPSMISCTLP